MYGTTQLRKSDNLKIELKLSKKPQNYGKSIRTV